jgi:hypothetical protein
MFYLVPFYLLQSPCCVRLDKPCLTPSDRPKTISAEYSAENYRPKRIFGRCCRKQKRYYLVTFNFKAIFFDKINIYLTLSMFYALYVFVAHKSWQFTATCHSHPGKHFCLWFKLTSLQCLLPYAKYSLLAEYSAAFSCRIFVFGQNKKIRWRQWLLTPAPSVSAFYFMRIQCAWIWSSRQVSDR